MTRVREMLSRLTSADRRTQITAVSITLVLLLVVAVIAWPSSPQEPITPALGTNSSESIGDLAEQALERGIELPSDDDTPDQERSSDGSQVEPDDVVTGDGPAPAPAITETEIKVGIAYVEDPGAANAAAGFGGIGQVDQKRAWQAMVDHVNEDPPFARKVVPVWYSMTTDEIQSKGAERISQEMCAHWTQDNSVFMVWGGLDDTLTACLNSAGVPQIANGAGLSWSKTYGDFPLLVSPTAAALDRMASFQVDKLHEAGFFEEFKENAPPYTPQVPADGKPRIGLIRYDQPSYKAGAKAMKDRLAHYGLSLCDGCEFEVSYSSDNVQEQLDDATEVNAAIQNCKSRPDGPCTHMLFLGSTAGVRITLFYVDGAEKQQYRPRLGLNPLDAPNAVRDFLGEASYPQFRDSMLVTWGPRDLGADPDAYTTCKTIFEDAGETFGGDDSADNKGNQIPGYCDTAWYFKAAMKAAGQTLDVESWLNGVHTMVPVPSAGTYVMQTKLGRHDGVGAIRRGEWFDDCNCFKPTSDIVPV